MSPPPHKRPGATFRPSLFQERTDMVTAAEIEAGVAIAEAIVSAIVKVAPAIQQGVVSSIPYVQAIAGLIQGNTATQVQIDATLAQINAATEAFLAPLPPADGATTT